MKKILQGFIFFFFIFNLTNSHAQVAYIDINFILNNSEVGKSLNNFLKSINDENLIKYKKIEDDLINKEKSLLAQQNIIDKNQFENKVKNLTNEINKYKTEKKISNDNLNKIKINNTKKILEILNPIITKYVETHSISLVFPKKNIIVGKKKLDITDKIIILLNDKIKTLNF